MRTMMKTCKTLFVLFCVLMACVQAGDTVRPGLEYIEYIKPTEQEMKLIDAVKKPLFDGLDVSAAMQDWFDGRLMDLKGDNEGAGQKWVSGLNRLDNLKPLSEVVWNKWPDASFTDVSDMRLRDMTNVRIRLVEWKAGDIQEYGLVIYPKNIPENAEYPLMLYCHGAAFGLPVSFMPRLAELALQGYVVIAPAMRGESVFTTDILVKGKVLKCGGDIENLEGEVDDCLSMLSAAWKLPFVKKDEFAVFGHSFGAGVGLLVAARGGSKAKAVVSYDAWLVNPQRYYWDRMRRGPRNWDSWEDFCNQPVLDQLVGLKKRSIIHNADMLECNMLLFMGADYKGSVFHESHDDFCAVLDKLKKKYRYVLIPDGDHNAVLRTESQPAKYAWKVQTEFLAENYPPFGKKAKKLKEKKDAGHDVK